MILAALSDKKIVSSKSSRTAANLTKSSTCPHSTANRIPEMKIKTKSQIGNAQICRAAVWADFDNKAPLVLDASQFEGEAVKVQSLAVCSKTTGDPPSGQPCQQPRDPLQANNGLDTSILNLHRGQSFDLNQSKSFLSNSQLGYGLQKSILLNKSASRLHSPMHRSRSPNGNCAGKRVRFCFESDILDYLK